MKIIDKIKNNAAEPYFSFEFFPPKTEAGVENLYLRMDRMTALQPIFVDVTWGAGGCTKELTMAICEYTQTYFGVDVLMHLTCTQLTVEQLKRILAAAKEAGIQNILALRGDPPKGSLAWEPMAGGCENAIDLVKLIRKEYGDYFCIGVAGFPEGHPHSKEVNIAQDILHLKEKVDAGADFVLTQFFYDPQIFLAYRDQCVAAGIHVPVIPGMMPIQSYSSFQKMTTFCKTTVPPHIWTALAPVKDDDEATKQYGVQLCVDMCKTLGSAGVKGFHFYTLNLEKSVTCVLSELGVTADNSRRAFPWRGSRANLRGHVEEVRPINWANRPKSYIKRTVNWDDYPNGRWGDNRSPAYGELSDSHFFRPVEGKKEDLIAMWGSVLVSEEDVFDVFAKYLEGKIPIIPWCESPLQPETLPLTSKLAYINRAGFLTINSQPAVNGEKSEHSVYGWGGVGGRVYQKAYVEFFTSPQHLHSIMQVCSKHPNLNYYAIDSKGLEHNLGVRSVTALTWGCFPNKEITQPTVFDPDSFVVWSHEVFQLWTKCWAALYDDMSESADLLYQIHDSYFLVAIIDNEYTDSHLMDIFDEVMKFENQQTARAGGSGKGGIEEDALSF